MTAPAAAVRNPLVLVTGAVRGTRDLFAELGGHLVFDLRVLGRVGTDIVGRLRYRGEVARQISDIAVGSGAWIFGSGMVFALTVGL